MSKPGVEATRRIGLEIPVQLTRLDPVVHRPAVRSGIHSKAWPAQDLSGFDHDPDRGNECTVRLRSIDDVRRPRAHVDL